MALKKLKVYKSIKTVSVHHRSNYFALYYATIWRLTVSWQYRRLVYLFTTFNILNAWGRWFIGLCAYPVPFKSNFITLHHQPLDLRPALPSLLNNKLEYFHLTHPCVHPFDFAKRRSSSGLRLGGHLQNPRAHFSGRKPGWFLGSKQQTQLHEQKI